MRLISLIRLHTEHRGNGTCAQPRHTYAPFSSWPYQVKCAELKRNQRKRGIHASLNSGQGQVYAPSRTL
jgi:hypothetical protein